MRGSPHALKVFILAGQTLALLFAIPMTYIGVQMYFRTARILVSGFSIETFCLSANPTEIILENLGYKDSTTCMLLGYDQNATQLELDCGTDDLPKCDFVTIFEWLTFVVRPVRLGLILNKYMDQGRFVSLVASDKQKTRVTLGRVEPMDFVMFTIMDGEAGSVIGFLATISFISYLKISSSFFLEKIGPSPLMLITLGISHCAACAEGLIIVGMIVLKLHSGIASHQRLLKVFSWKMYSDMLAPLHRQWLAFQLGAFMFLTVFHILMMRHLDKPLYLICVLGYPTVTGLAAYFNARTARSSVSDGSFKGERNERLCGLVAAMCEVSAEDLLYFLTFEKRTMVAQLTNYELVRLIQYSKNRIIWAKADARSARIADMDKPYAIAYVENGDVHIQMNDIALDTCEIKFVKFSAEALHHSKSFSRFVQA